MCSQFILKFSLGLNPPSYERDIRKQQQTQQEKQREAVSKSKDSKQ